ncbi:hypothetical protein chiPu_0019854 [Chiloscyllium punctatum]|uniref:CTCK domain-containing protein n=2 Tax=Chiloscyllium punctatum TaxID=137246 RepID=A0A401RTC1_CHIPU|nr:hypothetical protein [Chiloscyllium punctatum]
MIRITHDGCQSSDKIEIAECEGMCGTYSMYSSEVNSMEHKCNCCQEMKTHKREITLICPDGSTVQYSYVYVDSCHCMENNCEEPTSSLSNSTIHEVFRAKRSPDRINESGDKLSLINLQKETDSISFNEVNEANKHKRERSLENDLQENQPKERKPRHGRRANAQKRMKLT